MNRYDARALQDEILERGLHLPDLPRGGGRGMGADGVEVEPAGNLAVGIIGREDNYRIALRAVRRSAEAFSAFQRIRELAEGEVELEITGRVKALQEGPTPWHRSKLRDEPLVIGASLGHEMVGRGTLGAFVRRVPVAGESEDLADYVLSNNHVLAWENEGRKGSDPVLQPAFDDDPDPQVDDTVATLVDFVPLLEKHNLVDAAIARLNTDVTIDAAALRGLWGILQGVRPAQEALQEHEEVYKIGRTTGLRAGTLGATRIKDFEVSSYGSGIVRSFDEVIEIRSGETSFCEPGDSGSLLVDSQLRAIGLLFARAKKPTEPGGEALVRGYANPIRHVLKLLGVKLQH